MDEKIAVMEEQIKTLTNAPLLRREELLNSIDESTHASTGFQRASANSPSAHAQQNQSVLRHSTSHRKPRSMSNNSPLATARSSLTNTVLQPRLDTLESETTGSTVRPDNPSPEALSLMSSTETSRLIDLYEDETGSIYPFVDIEQVQSCANNFHYNSGRNRGVLREYGSGTNINRGWDNDSNILKIVLAIALAIEGCGLSEMGKKLVGEVELSIDQGIAATKADIRSLKVLTLMVSTAILLSNEADNSRAFTNFTATKRCLPGERLAWPSG